MTTPYGDWASYPEVEHLMSTARKLAVGNPVRNQAASEALQLSQAISLKRIADSLTSAVDIMKIQRAEWEEMRARSHANMEAAGLAGAKPS